MKSKILCSFQAFDVDGKSLVDFHIKFIEPEFYEEALSLMEEFFLPDESMNHARKTIKNRANVENQLKIWMKILESEKISIGCFKIGENCETLIGVNILCVKRKGEIEDDPELEPTTDDNRDIFEALDITSSCFNVFNHYQVDSYLSAFGVSVNSLYRGRGIAIEILKAREEVLRILEMKVTSTLFTGPASQKAALKAGFEENLTVTYDELYKINNRLHFQGLSSKSIKIMSLKIE